ncbi:MAG: hypothetical protein HQ521_01390 [Bacteroidetes bacterium]|nr:hypothetical protein [Bacteroidota bacterium]
MENIKNVTVNMPQMALEALSENWLFKEIGSIHWDMICKGLRTKSFDLKDDNGNRLYATFIRIRIILFSSLDHFRENDEINITGDIKRFGNSLYNSNIILDGNNKNIKAELLTSFSIRNDTDNNKLVKSQPADVENSISEYYSIPEFANEYRLIKKGVLKEVKSGNTAFSVNEDFIFETNYIINPYYDLNGVGLLYFASYPIISDFCEAQYFNKEFNNAEKWEQSYYTLTRDVFYYANCNIDDEINYKLHSFEFIKNDKIKLCSTLYRKSDNTILAKIFTIKSKKAKRL